MQTPKRIIVVGAGLSGLASAIRLKQEYPSAQVEVVEQNERAGGRCNTRNHDNCLTEVGCNEFGKSGPNLLRELGVDTVAFKAVKNRFFYPDGQAITSPFDLASIWTLFYVADLWRLKSAMETTADDASAAELTKDLTEPFRNILLSLVTYPALKPAEAVSVKLMKGLLGGDYSEPVVPVGGMGHVIDEMLRVFRGQGGTVTFGATCEILEEKTDAGVTVSINGEQRTGDIVVSSVHGWKRYQQANPDNTPSLAASVILFTISKDAEFVYPDGVHSMGFFPGSTEWLADHNNGRFATEYGFHVFNNDLIQPEVNARDFVVSAYVLTPKGLDTFDEERVAQIKGYVIDTVSGVFPDFEKSITDTVFYSPAAYRENFHSDSVIVPFTAADSDFVIDHRDPRKGLYYVGGSATPAHLQHGEGALLDAKAVLDCIIADFPPRQSLDLLPGSPALFSTTPTPTPAADSPQQEQSSTTCAVM